jgi:hypothetical protein
MLQVGRSRVPFPMSLLDFSIDLPSSRTMVLESTQTLTEMSTRNLSGGKGCRRVTLTTSPPSVSRLPVKVGTSTSHNPMGLNGLLQGQLYVFSFTFFYSPSEYLETGPRSFHQRRYYSTMKQLQLIQNDYVT